MDFIQQISSEQQENEMRFVVQNSTHTQNYVITCVLLLGLRGVSGMDFVGWWWFMLVGDVGGNMWFHYLWACWEGQKHWSNLRECRWEYRSYNGFSWYCMLFVANVLIVSSQLNSMTFGFVLEIGCW